MFKTKQMDKSIPNSQFFSGNLHYGVIVLVQNKTEFSSSVYVWDAVSVNPQNGYYPYTTFILPIIKSYIIFFNKKYLKKFFYKILL